MVSLSPLSSASCSSLGARLLRGGKLISTLDLNYQGCPLTDLLPHNQSSARSPAPPMGRSSSAAQLTGVKRKAPSSSPAPRAAAATNRHKCQRRNNSIGEDALAAGDEPLDGAGAPGGPGTTTTGRAEAARSTASFRSSPTGGTAAAKKRHAGNSSSRSIGSDGGSRGVGIGVTAADLAILVRARSSAVASGTGVRSLRYCSLQVCEALAQKKAATYNELADQLVESATAEAGTRRQGLSPTECKNIRRRVYDALNVLLALGVLCRDKKNLMWRGLERMIGPASPGSAAASSGAPSAAGGSSASAASSPPLSFAGTPSNSPAFWTARKECSELQDKIRSKQSLLEELTLQFVGTSAVASRNHGMDAKQLEDLPEDGLLVPPFVLLEAPPDANILCQVCW